MLQLRSKISETLLKDKSNNKLSLLYFTASWCGPCKSISPNMDKLSESFKKNDKNINCYKIDIDDDDDGYALSNNVNSVPTFFIMDGNEKLSMAKGANFFNICDMILNIYNKKYTKEEKVK